MTYDYIIIGGGITGITAARLLQLSGVERLAILEAGAETGGLCRTKEVGGHVLDTGGGHFLCTKHPEVYDFIFRHIPKSEFNFFHRVSRIAIDGHEVDYPLETNLWQLPPALCAEYLVSVARNGEARGLPAPTQFEQWIRWKLGDLVAERYMLPYNRKIWGVPASEMDVDWLYKIPRLDVKQIIESCLAHASDKAHMPSHAGFYYPKQGGYQRVFDAIAEPVKPIIETNCPVTSIERVGDELVINGQYRTKQIINTAPWPTLINAPVLAEVRESIGQLRHNQIVVSLHEADYKTNAHWLYEPDANLRHHRSFYIHNFAPHSARNGFYRETNLERWVPNTGEVYSETNQYAYPVPTVGWAKAIDTVLAHARTQGIHGLGRWGQWQYFNSDVCVHEAMQLVDRLGHRSWRGMINAATAAAA